MGQDFNFTKVYNSSIKIMVNSLILVLILTTVRGYKLKRPKATVKL